MKKEIIELLSNNFGKILQVLGVIFPLSFLFNIFQYVKGKKFDKYNNEKDLKIKIAELKKENNDYLQSIGTPFHIGDFHKLQSEHELTVEKIEAEIECLRKIMK